MSSTGRKNDDKKQRQLARARELYALNRDKMIAKVKCWYIKNKAKVSERTKQQRIRDRDSIAIKRREYRIKHRVELNAKQREYAKNNPHKIKESFNKWALKYKDRLIVERALNWSENAEDNRAKSRAYYRSNRDTILPRLRARAKKQRAKQREIERRYLIKNRAKVYAKIAKREAMKRHLTHPLADHSNIQLCFKAAREASRTTGVLHAVDHIIPMARGGFHHHDNLQVLSFSMNSSKSDNAFWISPSPEYRDWRDVPRELWPFDLAPKYIELIEKNKGVSIRWDAAA